MSIYAARAIYVIAHSVFGERGGQGEGTDPLLHLLTAAGGQGYLLERGEQLEEGEGGGGGEEGRRVGVVSTCVYMLQ